MKSAMPMIIAPGIALLALGALLPISDAGRLEGAPRLECWGCEECSSETSAPQISVLGDHTWIGFVFYCSNNPFPMPCGWGGCSAFAANERLDALATELTRYALAGDAAGVGDIVASNPERVVLAPERQAVQVIRSDYCAANEVYAHIPLSSDVMATVAAAAR